MKRMAETNEHVFVDDWPLTRDQTCLVELVNYEGRWRLDVRVWFRSPDGVQHPGKGLAVSVLHIPRLASALEKACQEAARLELI